MYGINNSLVAVLCLLFSAMGVATRVLNMQAAGWARSCYYGLVAGPEAVRCRFNRALVTSPPPRIRFLPGNPQGEVSGMRGQLLLCAAIKWHLKVHVSSEQPEMAAAWRKGPS